MSKDLYNDNLTGLFNERYMENTYHQYRKKNPEARLIMIDLQNFKCINDTYGYLEGDNALKTMADELRLAFNKTDRVFRLHGDEYSVLTTKNPQEIREVFGKIDKNLETKFNNKLTESRIRFNSGDVKLQRTYKDSMDNATIMLHEAKRRRSFYVPFDADVWVEEINRRKYIMELDEIISNHQISHKTRTLFNSQYEDSGIKQLYTKNILGENFLINDETIKNTNGMQDLDMKNIEDVTNSIQCINGNIIILLNSFTLFRYDSILKILDQLSEKEKSKLIFSIDMRNIEQRDIQYITYIIKVLKEHHIKILLDKCDYTMPDALLLQNQFEYVRMNPELWKNAMIDEKTYKTLVMKAKLYSEVYGSILIFDHITSEKEMFFIENISGEDSLYAGEILSDEIPIQFVKKRK